MRVGVRVKFFSRGFKLSNGVLGMEREGRGRATGGEGAGEVVVGRGIGERCRKIRICRCFFVSLASPKILTLDNTKFKN